MRLLERVHEQDDPCEGQGLLLLLARVGGDVHDAVRGALLELQRRHGLLNAGVGQVQKLLRREVLEVDLVELGGADEDGVVGEVDGLGGLVRGELVAEDEVTSLAAPLKDGHQVVIGRTQVHAALDINIIYYIKKI